MRACRRDANQEGYCNKEQQNAARNIVGNLYVNGSHESCARCCVMCHTHAQKKGPEIGRVC